MRKLLFILFFIPGVLMSQDSTKVFTQQEVIWFVKKFHPVAIQSSLLVQAGESSVLQARGGFDPYAKSTLDQKYYDDKSYYSLLNAGLNIPTWYGLEVKAGYDQNTGQFLNPENNLPDDGLWYAGISIPLGQGLFIDKRRAALKQAQIFAEASMAEQRIWLNNLIFDAIQSYWTWVESYNEVKVFEESVDLAQTRFEAVVQSFKFGDNPAIDTLEAFIQVQNRQLSLIEAQLKYQKQTLELSNFLWFENNTPLEISSALRPPLVSEIPAAQMELAELDSVVTQLVYDHPELQQLGFQLSSLDIDRRLSAEYLKPKLNFNYNALYGGANDTETFSDAYDIGNYKWGFEFNLPLLLRAERGKLQLAKIKIQDTELKQQQKILSIQNKVRKYYAEQTNLQSQLNMLGDVVTNYQRLLDGEKQKFSSGESSLFLINSREIKLIEARLKQNSTNTKYWIALNGIDWASGQLGTVE